MDDDDNRTSDHHRKSKRNRYRQLDHLQGVVKFRFRDKSLLSKALTHRSFINECGISAKDNERLEYLGDSVLALVVNEYLFKKFEDYLEGDLAKIKSAVVSEATLSIVAREINLGSYIVMGRGEEMSGGRDRTSILANTVEALIGAVYLDAGLKESRRFVLGLLKESIERISRHSYYRDPKTTLQEYIQKKYKDRPEYRVLEENGPDHNKSFLVQLVVQGRDICVGAGSSKRKAEVEAALHALEILHRGDDAL